MSIISDALKTWLLSRQKEGESLTEYTKRYKTAVEVLESHMGGPLVLQNYVQNMDGYKSSTEEFVDSVMEDEGIVVQQQDKEETKKLVVKAFDQLVAFVYLENADKKKYGSLIHNLSQQQSLKNDQYPKTIADATQAISNHKLDNACDKKTDKEKQSGQGNGSGNGY